MKREEGATMYKIIGRNRRTYARETPGVGLGQVRDESSTVTVVLVEGTIGDYAAYIGMGDPQFVAASGDKLSYAEACGHFAGLEEGQYRA